MTQHDRYWQAKKVTFLGAVSNLLLGIIKLISGHLFHSHALLADGVHSIADLLADALVLFASKYGSLDADANHPYGHQRIETAATLFLSILLILTGLAIAWDSIENLLQTHHATPSRLTLPIICLSIISNEVLFHYTLSVGKRINSQLITANAWHHRSDAASSLIVFIGLFGAMAGWAYLDSVAALIVGFMIVKMGWSYTWNSTKELVDTAVSPELLRHMEYVIQKVHGVQKIHQLRSRSMGDSILIDVHILVSPRISVSEGHYIAQHVHHALINDIERIKDVVVHVDPEDDELSTPSLHLPNRKEVQEQLLNEIHKDFPQILFCNLHYLESKIDIDIVCEATFSQWQELHCQIIQTLNQQTDSIKVRLFSLHETIHHN